MGPEGEITFGNLLGREAPSRRRCDRCNPARTTRTSTSSRSPTCGPRRMGSSWKQSSHPPALPLEYAKALPVRELIAQLSENEQRHAWAEVEAALLKCAKPADLPVEQPTEFTELLKGDSHGRTTRTRRHSRYRLA